MKFICTVRRMQVWRNIEVEADDKEEAKDKADEIADSLGTPDEDYAYETTAREAA